MKTVKEEKKVAVDTKKSSQQETSNGERMMKISMIEPNREQPRKKFDEDALQELSESIKQYGILQPLLVSDKKDYYEIVAGERRWRAAKMAGLKEVPVVVKEFSTQEIVEISLIENIQREDLNPVEEAMAYKRLIDEFHLKQDEIAERVSKSRTAVSYTHLDVYKRQGLDNSLNSAMDSIRSSVHDLHDDAVNLQETIKGIITDIKMENVEFEYDMSEIIPREIKYCFISIVKEAISNAMKYSSATQIKIIMREHPAIYQLCIEDNGKGCADYDKNTTGIGLKNVQERVNTLNGNLQINGEKGFRIFVVIPKQNRAE